MEYCIRSGLIKESRLQPIYPPRVTQKGWGLSMAHRCGWRLGIGGSRLLLSISLSDRVLDWLRSHSSYVGVTALPDQHYRLGTNGPVDCSRSLLITGRRNLGDSFREHGGAGTYWASLVYLALRGDIVGDIRRYTSHLPDAEDIWLSKSVKSLLTLGIVDKTSCDRLLGVGTWCAKAPPLPPAGVPFVLDACCGYQSLYYDLLIHHPELGYICFDYRRRLYRGDSGWVKPHVVVDLRAIEGDPAEVVLAAVNRPMQLLRWYHGSAPCTSHSTANGSNGDEAYGLYGPLGESCPVYCHDVSSARALATSMVRCYTLYGVPYSLENPSGGTFGDLPFIKELHFCDISYCCYGFTYRCMS